MDTRNCVREVRKMKEEGYTLEVLACIISDVLNKHRNSPKGCIELSNIERCYAGLRYSEFLVDDGDYVKAEVIREQMLKALKINPNDLYDACKRLGLS